MLPLQFQLIFSSAPYIPFLRGWGLQNHKQTFRHIGFLLFKENLWRILFESNSLVIEVIATNSHSGVPSFPKWFLATSHMISWGNSMRVTRWYLECAATLAVVLLCSLIDVLRWWFYMLWVAWGIN